MLNRLTRQPPVGTPGPDLWIEPRCPFTRWVPRAQSVRSTAGVVCGALAGVCGHQGVLHNPLTLATAPCVSNRGCGSVGCRWRWRSTTPSGF